MSYTNLLEILKQKESGQQLVIQIEKIKSNAKPLLAKIPETFPDYTAHDIGHKEKVLEKMRLVLPDSLAKNMNQYEIFFLISAVYLHDVGMANLPELLPKDLKITTESRLSDFIRDNHHTRIENFIQKNYVQLGLDDHHQARIIGRISRGHRKENLFDKDLFDFNEVYKDVSINVPMLASLLRIADELDMTFERTPMIVYEKKPPRDSISKLEWEKHLSVSGVTLHPDDNLTIISKARCEKPKIHRLLKNLESKINDELDALPYHLHHYRTVRKDIPRKFVINIHAVDYEPKDIKFTLQEKQIFSILMGDKLYKSKEDSVREILKNSIDACKLRQDILHKEKREYEPKIVIKISDDYSSMIISDNGMGMDEDIVERYFTKIGVSFYQSNEFLGMSHDFNPVGELGIGTLACFMLSDKIFVDSKMESSSPLLLEIDGISDYFFVKESMKKDVGTDIILSLKDEFKNHLEVEKIVRHFIRHCDIPIKIIQFGKESVITDNGYRLDESYFQFKRDEQKTPILKHFDLNEKYVKGSIGFCGEAKEGDWLPLTNWYIKYETDFNRVFTSKDGIFVSHEKILPDWINVKNMYVDLDIRNNSIDLAVSRDTIVTNEKLTTFQDNLDIVFQNWFEQIFEAFNTIYDKKISTGLIRNFFNSYITGLRTLERPNMNDYHSQKSIRPFVLNFYKKHYPIWIITKNGILSSTPKEITDRNKPIIRLSGLSFKDEQYMIKLLNNVKNFDENYTYVINRYDDYQLFDSYERHFTSFFNMERTQVLDEILPKTWLVVKIHDFETDRLFEYFSSYSKTLVNQNNKFISFLIENLSKMTNEQKMILEGFFKTLKIKSKGRFQEVIESQKIILRNFVESGLLTKDFESLLLTSEDVDWKG